MDGRIYDGEIEKTSLILNFSMTNLDFKFFFCCFVLLSLRWWTRAGGAGGRCHESGGSERVLAGLHLTLEGEASGWVRWGEDGDGRM